MWSTSISRIRLQTVDGSGVVQRARSDLAHRRAPAEVVARERPVAAVEAAVFAEDGERVLEVGPHLRLRPLGPELGLHAGELAADVAELAQPRQVVAPRVERMRLAEVVEHDRGAGAGVRELGQPWQLLLRDAGVEDEAELAGAGELRREAVEARLALEHMAHALDERRPRARVEIVHVRDDARGGAERLDPRHLARVAAVGLDEDQLAFAVVGGQEPPPQLGGQPVVAEPAGIPEVHVRVYGASPRSDRERDRRLRRRHPEREALLEIEVDRVLVVGAVADRQVLAGLQEEVAAAHADEHGAFDPGRAYERAAGDLDQVLEHRVAAVLGRLDDLAVAAGPERESVRARDALAQHALGGARDGAGGLAGLITERDRLVRARLGDADDAGLLPAVEDGDVLGQRDVQRGLVERVEVDVLGAALGGAQLLA